VNSINPHRKEIMMKKIAFGFGLLAPLTGAFAAVPAEVTTALGEMKVDATAVAALVLVAVIAVAAIKFMRKGL
jgi:Inovirus Coat protein B